MSKFCLFKLNGVIGGTIKDDENFIPMEMDYNISYESINEETMQNFFSDMLLRYYYIEKRIENLNYSGSENTQDEYPTIMYSWEKKPIFEKVRLNAIEATKGTDILVIIGYSFPTFNRGLDKKILKNMVNLKKVYIQSPENTIKGVIQRFKALYAYS